MLRNYLFTATAAVVYVGILVYKDRRKRRCKAFACNGIFTKMGEITIAGKGMYQIYKCPVCGKIYEKSNKTQYQYKEFESVDAVEEIKRKLKIQFQVL